MKGNEKGILIGSLIVAVLLVFASYRFFYSEDVAKADQVQSEINTLQTRLNELNAKRANWTMYEAGIADSADIIDTILSLYGPGNTSEKSIMMVVDLCKKTGISVSNISFQENAAVYTSESLKEDGKPEIVVYKTGISIDISSGYTQLKKVMDYVNSHPERMNVENFSAKFNAETGRLAVTVKINLYSVDDDKHEYVEPVVEDIDLGTNNIFRTFEQAEEETEEGEENAKTSAENNTAESGDNGATE